jgi:hypothetical protein
MVICAGNNQFLLVRFCQKTKKKKFEIKNEIILEVLYSRIWEKKEKKK